jgi:citrate lyase subunit beta/citryl-CoA lyase
VDHPTTWRSLLFAPANRPDLTAKLPRSRPDAVVLDLEDSVPADGKAPARAAARAAAAALLATPAPPAVLVRVNPVDSPWFHDDLAAALVPGVAAVVVPKLSSAADVAAATRALGDDGPGVVAGIETAAGVWAVREVLGPVVVACYFGAEDYVADLGGVRTAAGHEVLYARSRVALAARLAGVPAFDMIVADFGDDDRFTRECAEARALGYRGKLCIHPRQVPLAAAGFRPSPAEVDAARALLATWARASARGEAAVAHEGRMVDEPLAAQARAVVAAAGTPPGGGGGVDGGDGDDGRR